MRLFSPLLLLATASISTAMAQTTPANAGQSDSAARGPTLELALEAARTAIATCAARDQKIGVTVVDSIGTTKVVLGADGASLRGVTSSTHKALTALHFKSATSILGEQAKTDRNLSDAVAANPNFNIRAGGMVIRAGNDVVGAIGVGGARGSEVDEACALAGLQKIQERVK